MIKFIDNTDNTNGNGIAIGGGLTVIGSGESASQYANLTTDGSAVVAGDSE